MAMSKQDFIVLADDVRRFNRLSDPSGITAPLPFTDKQIECLADFCAGQSPRFNRERWLDYLNGKCGPNGGTK
jgi:hypothetical protein